MEDCFRLFERSARGYALTAAGEQMLASAERVEDEILGLERRLRGGDVRLSGTLRVTTTDTLVHGLLGPHLRAFQAAYPVIELELIAGNAFFDLSKREADVALRPSRHPGDAMVGRRLAEIAVALYGAYRRDRLLFGDKPAAVPAVAMAAVAGIVALACAAGIASILAVHQPGSSGTQDGARPPARAVHR